MGTVSTIHATAGSPPLIVRIGAMGDMVLLTPLLDVLVDHYGCSCDLIGSHYAVPLFKEDPRIGKIYTIRSYNRPFLLAPDQQQLVLELKSRDPGPVYLLDTHPRIRRMLIRGGINPKSIYSRGKEGRIAGIHVVTDNLKLARHIGYSQEDLVRRQARGTRLIVSDSAKKDIAEVLMRHDLSGKPYIVVQAGTSRSFKRKKLKFKKHWPADRWVILIKNLLDEYPGVSILLSGARAESEFIEDLVRDCGSPRVINMAVELTIPRLMALMQSALCCISVDTGPAHVAAAVGCPLAVLFGGTFPGRTSPVSCGSRISIVVGPPGATENLTEREWLARHSMLGITPAMVLDAVRDILPASSAD